MDINQEVFKSPEWSLTDAEVRILAELYLAMDKGKRPSELKEATRLSEPTLHKYLKILELKKLIKKEKIQQPREYPHPVFYTLADNEKAIDFAESSYEWIHKVDREFNELQYVRRVLKVVISKLLNKNIDEIQENSVYELAEEVRQGIAQVLKKRDSAQLSKEDKEFIGYAEYQKEHKIKHGFYGVTDFFIKGVYPSKQRKTQKKEVRKEHER